MAKATDDSLIILLAHWCFALALSQNERSQQQLGG